MSARGIEVLTETQAIKIESACCRKIAEELFKAFGIKTEKVQNLMPWSPKSFTYYWEGEKKDQ